MAAMSSINMCAASCACVRRAELANKVAREAVADGEGEDTGRPSITRVEDPAKKGTKARMGEVAGMERSQSNAASEPRRGGWSDCLWKFAIGIV